MVGNNQDICISICIGMIQTNNICIGIDIGIYYQPDHIGKGISIGCIDQTLVARRLITVNGDMYSH